MKVENITFYHVDNNLSVGHLFDSDQIKIRQRGIVDRNQPFSLPYDEINLTLSQWAQIVHTVKMVKMINEVSPITK